MRSIPGVRFAYRPIESNYTVDRIVLFDVPKIAAKNAVQYKDKIDGSLFAHTKTVE